MIKVESLVINITDICNMSCEFCLRGDGRGRKMDLSLIPKIFEGIGEVGCLVISGGEPSCYKEAVTAIVDYLVENEGDIDINGLFIATNGKEYCQELVDAVKTMMFVYLEKQFGMYETVGGREAAYYDSVLKEVFYMFGLAVSLDEFHDPILLENWFKYRISGVYSSTKQIDYSKSGIIARGRGIGLPNAGLRKYYRMCVNKDRDDITASEVYVTVNGKVFGDCDMSYNMEENEVPAGNLNEETLAEVINRIMEKESEE